MKNKVMAIGMLLVLTGLPAFGAGKKIVVNVNGMVCSMCAQGIPKKLNAQPEIESFKIAEDWKTVTINLKEGKDLSDEKVQQLIKDAGVAVTSINRGNVQ